MEPRVLLLAIPSLVVLVLLIVHSWRALPRRRALAFWISVAVYGLARGLAVTWITERGLGAAAPYEIRDPLLPVFGVSLQEVAGWAIVAYLAWWLGDRFSRQLFQQAAWGCLFLGAISWAVETAAVAAGWWRWTVPAGSPLLLGVPWIGLVDWFFVGTDFLLPFLVLTAPALAGRPARFLSLLLFPLHMASHLWLEPVFGIPGLHLVHWLLLGLVLWLAFRSPVEDEAFPRTDWLPLMAIAVILADIAGVEAVVVGRPGLLASLLPVAGVVAGAFHRNAGGLLGVLGGVGSFVHPPMVLGVVPMVAADLLRWARRRRWAAPAVLALLAALAAGVHASGGAQREDLQKRLDAALAARDRGDLATATAELESLTKEYPAEHAPHALLGEIRYRTSRPAEARPLFERAVAIKSDFLQGYRTLAVIDLQAGNRDSAARFAARGRAVDPNDLELRYLEKRAKGEGSADLWPAIQAKGPAAAEGMAALAFEVGDAAGAAEILDRALARFPDTRSLYRTRIQLALGMKSEEAARRAASSWLERFPDDLEAKRVAAGLPGGATP